MSNNDNKAKLLLFGRVGDQIPAFCAKVQALHKSKAGPFDLCFCVGSFYVPVATDHEHYALVKALPIPVYLQDAVIAGNSANDANNNNSEIVTLVEPNLKAFGESANVWNVPIPRDPHASLVVASCPPRFRIDDKNNTAVKSLLDKLTHVSYVGCDLLLSSDWPQGLESLATDQVQRQARQSATFDLADVALRARARYHVVPAHSSINLFWQSPPFEHLAATTSTVKPQHTGRLLAMGQVVADKKVGKQHKFVHALGLVPLHHMTTAELAATSSSNSEGVVACPFTDASYATTSNSSSGGVSAAHSSINVTSGLSEAQARRLLAESNGGAQQRWNLPNNNRKRSKPGDEANDSFQDQLADDPTNTTLFLHGLHKDVSGQLQSAAGDINLLQAFRRFGVAKVRKPPNAATSSYAFLEFPTHLQAKECLETLGGQTTIGGVSLTLKWGTAATSRGGRDNHNQQQQQQQPAHGSNKRPRLTEAQAKDSSTVYFRLPTRILSDDYDAVSEQLRQWMEATLENALNEEGTPDEERVTAANEPALQVTMRRPRDNNGDDDNKKKNFGFLDFASHAAASMALATLTGSTDGGLVLKKEDKGASNGEEDKGAQKETGQASEPSAAEKDERNEPYEQNEQEKADTAEFASSKKPEPVWGVALHWAHVTVDNLNDNIHKSREDQMIHDADSAFKFRRQHFPADSRHDCWFCLASDGCEKHLITGVYDHCYAAMPKGPVHKGHLLLIPVTHSSNGALIDTAVSDEMEALRRALRRHAQEEYGMDLFVFERAIQTKGGYHTHVQCVPVAKGLGIKLETTLRAQAKANNMDFREIQSPDLVLSSLFNDEDGDGGYFYAEVPLPGERLEYKRFLHKVQAEHGNSGPKSRPHVPLQFGREVLAAVMGKAELAHWKACQVYKKEETEMASEFRESFAKYCSS